MIPQTPSLLTFSMNSLRSRSSLDAGMLGLALGLKQSPSRSLPWRFRASFGVRCAHRCGISPVSKTCFFRLVMRELLFCGIDCVQTHPDQGLVEFRGKAELNEKLEDLEITRSGL